MKIFLSHKQQDQSLALHVQQRLETKHQIACYLDVIDLALERKGEDLAAYLRAQMAHCTHLIAVVSPATKQSSWVPWEVGVATERDMPLATYSDGTRPLEFLEKWPYMMTMLQLDAYAVATKNAEQIFENRSRTATASVARSEATKQFYVRVRAALNQ